MTNKLSPIQIKIRNYQSIQDLDFEVKGFTTITGVTNIGKSAIMRSVYSSIMNHSVIGMVRKGASFCSVDLKSPNWEFRWEKGEKVGRYTIGEKIYDKIGQKQLEQISSLGFNSIEVADQEIQPWCAQQFFPIFLLDKSGGQVTDFISEVSKLNVFQDSIVLSARKKKRCTDEAKTKADETTRLKSQLSKFNDADLLNKIEKDLQDQAHSIKEYENKISIGEQSQDRIKRSTARINTIQTVEKILIPDNEFSDLFDRTKLMSILYQNLELCARKIISVKGVVNVNAPDSDLNTVIEKLKSAEKHKSKISSLTNTVKSLSTTVKIPDMDIDTNKLTRLEILHGKIQTSSKEVKTLNNQLEQIEKDLEKLSKDIVKIPYCPTCKKPTREHTC